MCFTGGFAIAAAVEPAVLAPVASQPSVPFPVSARHRADLGVSDGERDAVAARVRDEGLCLLGLRFSADSASPATRFEALQARFGDGFRVIELDSSPGNPNGFARSSHAVLTHETVDRPGPAHDAREQVLAFLAERLQAG
ncbi:hypothetical protein GCM10025868_22250 [Angustibacter aerolatus]|uniref:Uncharacterized protein n=1 Tax=Angustibacter aerolatus TaxID=1162965 RepID=A0ABQ6JIA8_9ACTN|nr:hypothetical protein [Angustibacter aerolatus]GMA86975.1 hypothetical protein GCM10025868_22250 [Angustibacter aerolatus]